MSDPHPPRFDVAAHVDPAVQAREDAVLRRALERVASIQDDFIARYLLATGASIRDTMLVQQNGPNGTIRFWCEPRRIPRDGS